MFHRYVLFSSSSSSTFIIETNSTFFRSYDFGKRSKKFMYIFLFLFFVSRLWNEKKCCLFAISINLRFWWHSIHQIRVNRARFLDPNSSISSIRFSILFKSFDQIAHIRKNSNRKNHQIKWIGLVFEINFKIINNTSFKNVDRDLIWQSINHS